MTKELKNEMINKTENDNEQAKRIGEFFDIISRPETLDIDMAENQSDDKAEYARLMSKIQKRKQRVKSGKSFLRHEDLFGIKWNVEDNIDDFEDFGNIEQNAISIIKHWRSLLGLTQSEYANLIGVRRDWVSKLETCDRCALSSKKLNDIFERLNIIPIIEIGKVKMDLMSFVSSINSENRNAVGISQVKLGNLINLSQDTISRIEDNPHNMQLKYLDIIFAALGVEAKLNFVRKQTLYNLITGSDGISSQVARKNAALIKEAVLRGEVTLTQLIDEYELTDEMVVKILTGAYEK